MLEPRRLTLILCLTAALFVLDYLLPLGVATGVLYAFILFLTAASASHRLPWLAAAIASVLLIVGGTGHISDDIPLWMGLANRALSIVVVWGTLFFLLQRRRAETALQDARDSLEVRVHQRTSELAQVNKALVAEITERIETEQSLRTSEKALEASRLALQHSQQELRALTARLLTAQEEERRRISRDLHDDINQRLAMVVVELEGLERTSPELSATLSSRLRSLQDNVAELSEDIRHLAYQYHPSVLDDLGLTVALQRLVEDFSQRAGLPCTFSYEHVPELVPPEIATCLYRLTQESLTNAGKHAQAARIGVVLRGIDEELILTIMDDGVGFDSNEHRGSSPSLGLISMKERAHLIQGELQVESAPGRGTSIRIRIPLTPR